MPDNPGLHLLEGASIPTIAGVSTNRVGFLVNAERGPVNKATLVTDLAEYYRLFGAKPAAGDLASFYAMKAFFAGAGSAPAYVVRVASSSALKANVTLQDRQGTPANTLKIEALSEGIWGNALSVKISDDNILSTKPASDISSSATSAVLVSISGLEVGSDVEFDNTTNQEQVRITAIDAPSKTIHWTGGLTNAYPAATSTAKSLEFKIEVYDSDILAETIEGLSMNDDVSFFAESKVASTSSYIIATDLKSTDTDHEDRPAVTASAQPLTSGNDGLSDVIGTDYSGSQANKTGLWALDAVTGLFRVAVLAPKLTDADPAAAYDALVQAVIDYANTRVTVTAYIDVPMGKSITDAITWAAGFEGRRVLPFYPWLRTVESGLDKYISPAAEALGIVLEKDARRGVHKAMGNEGSPYVIGFEQDDLAVNDAEHQLLNEGGINVFRVPFPGYGIKLFGSVTRSNQNSWKFANHSEYFNWIGISLMTSLRWVAFEPINDVLMKNIKRVVEAFFRNEQRKGAVALVDPSGVPYRVIIDSSNNPQSEIAAGKLRLDIEYVPAGVAERFYIRLTSSPGGFTTISE